MYVRTYVYKYYIHHFVYKQPGVYGPGTLWVYCSEAQIQKHSIYKQPLDILIPNPSNYYNYPKNLK